MILFEHTTILFYPTITFFLTTLAEHHHLNKQDNTKLDDIRSCTFIPQTGV